MIRRALVATVAGATVAALLMACAAPPTNAGPKPRDPVPRAHLTDCTNLPALPTARCGTINVDLDRAHPSAGKTRVAFAVIPHTDRSQPSLGAVATNPGGPGGSTIDFAGPLYAAGLAPLLERRDLVLMDTRGSGRSDPLTCAALSGTARVFADTKKQRELVGECGHQLGARAADYGTTAIADDLDQVRASLRIKKLDLLGDSYGTYLMATYAQRHPDHVRSVVLSGAYAVNIDPSGEVAAKALRRGIRLVCERTSRCDGDQVLDDLSQMAIELRKHPTTVDIPFGGTTHTVVLDESQWAGAVSRVYSGPADVDSELALAHAAAQARKGDFDAARALMTTDLTTIAGAIAEGPSNYSDVAVWATTCHDYPRAFDYHDTPKVRARDFDRQVATLDDADFAPFSARAWTTRPEYDTGICLEWPNDHTAKAPFAPGAALPDVPVLVLSGDLDANTPSASGKEAAAQFPHATWVEVEGSGHTPTRTEKGVALILKFIKHPHH